MSFVGTPRPISAVAETFSQGFGGDATQGSGAEVSDPEDAVFRLSARQTPSPSALQPGLAFTLGDTHSYIYLKVGGERSTSFKCRAGTTYEMRVDRMSGVCTLVLRDMATQQMHVLRNAKTPLENPVFVVTLPKSGGFKNVKQGFV